VLLARVDFGNDAALRSFQDPNTHKPRKTRLD
jgi:hypothetical protein